MQKIFTVCQVILKQNENVKFNKMDLNDDR